MEINYPHVIWAFKLATRSHLTSLALDSFNCKKRVNQILKKKKKKPNLQAIKKKPMTNSFIAGIYEARVGTGVG